MGRFRGRTSTGMSISNATKSTALLSGDSTDSRALYLFTLAFQNSTHGSAVKLFFLCVTDISPSVLPGGVSVDRVFGGILHGVLGGDFL